jgi:uncharacterized repeat protein (TIGR03803 family)
LSRSGEKWSEQVLHAFKDNGTDGFYPYSALVFDASGDLYGTTNEGGAYDEGTVFELEPGSDGTWTEKLLHAFTGFEDGGQPTAGLVFDQSGNLYGTSYAGQVNDGTVFQLLRKTEGWSFNILHQFATQGTDGQLPMGNLTFDQSGNMFGTTEEGGANGSGTVFQLVKNARGWTEGVLYSFCAQSDCLDGDTPQNGAVIGTDGNLYGTTLGGGSGGYGTVFTLASGVWNETVIYSFTGGNDGNTPVGSLVFGSGGVYGETYRGGLNGWGVVYEIVP